MAEPKPEDFYAQGPAVRGLFKSLQEGAGVHACLISGLEGVGKRTLARLAAQTVLCTGENRPCGECAACRSFLAGTHPDVLVVHPGVRLDPNSDKTSKQIIVDDIRVLVTMAGQHSYSGDTKVFIMEDCDKMNASAANALLKTLEEPPQRVLFLLLTTKPESLLPTIISRCLNIKLHPWSDDVVRKVLSSDPAVPKEHLEEAVRLGSGSIGRALAAAKDVHTWERRAKVMQDFLAIGRRSDIISVSAEWKDRKDDLSILFDDLESMLRALLMVRLGNASTGTVSSYPALWQKAAVKMPPEDFAALLDTLREARWMRINNVTPQAVLERVLLQLLEKRSHMEEN